MLLDGVLSDGVPLCLQETHNGIQWSMTAVNSVDIKPCPEGYEGLHTHSIINIEMMLLLLNLLPYLLLKYNTLMIIL